MVQTTNEEFQELINEALGELPGEHAKNLENVAMLYEEEPTLEQRQKLELRHDQTLLGLYEGVPLAARQGTTRLLPDKITLFKGPLERRTNTTSELKEQIKHTLWHEIAHYYGLDHKGIASLDNRS
jgi:predicted Zn-dependent protease with MMP-like domain